MTCELYGLLWLTYVCLLFLLSFPKFTHNYGDEGLQMFLSSLGLSPEGPMLFTCCLTWEFHSEIDRYYGLLRAGVESRPSHAWWLLHEINTEAPPRSIWNWLITTVYDSIWIKRFTTNTLLIMVRIAYYTLFSDIALCAMRDHDFTTSDVTRDHGSCDIIRRNSLDQF